jgi:nascent polypeptide-associated complex subunit alpha
MMKQMGLKMDELSDIHRIVMEGKNRDIVIEGAMIAKIDMQGQTMYQIAGGQITETSKEQKLKIPEEDVLLVSQQANVSLERARAALEDAEGDLAKAILILSTN